MLSNPGPSEFRSNEHPGVRGKAVVASSSLVRPLGFCMLPVMTGALFSMLQGYQALSWLTIGFPLAAACASAWTWHAIRSEICEVHIAEGRVAVRSLFDAAEPLTDLRWKWLIDLRTAPDQVQITLGLSIIQLNRQDWPQWEELLGSLHWAVHSQPENAPGR